MCPDEPPSCFAAGLALHLPVRLHDISPAKQRPALSLRHRGRRGRWPVPALLGSHPPPLLPTSYSFKAWHLAYCSALTAQAIKWGHFKTFKNHVKTLGWKADEKLLVALVSFYPLSSLHCISLQRGARFPYLEHFRLTKHMRNRNKPHRGVRGIPSQWEGENQNFWLKKSCLEEEHVCT